jgi:hypothetical protein
MRTISNVLLILAFSQLTACAVMSKQECLGADWQQVGYQVGVNGNTDISEQFNRRQQTCIKYGTKAGWQKFRDGHADGLVQFCQLSNALELGIKGVSRAIDDQACAERDYPGFREAFNIGYQLHILEGRVLASNSAISNLTNSRYRYQQSNREIRQILRQDDIDKRERRRLRYRLQENRDHLYHIDREVKQNRQRLDQEQSEANRYVEQVYDDYLFSLSDRFIDPRMKATTMDKPKQSEFDDRIDEILNQ